MYAIVEIAGQQFKVAKDQKVFVNRLAGEEGDKVSFDKVLLSGDGDNITLGAPAIDGALVDAKITRHVKGDKVIVFKKKRRKGYRVKNGHRQSLTEISIVGITLSGGKKSSSAKAEPKKEASKADTKAKAKKEVEVSENLVTRAEHRTEGMEINIDKILHSIGTATKSDADDLKEINGIGPAYETKLNEIGIYTYEQISKLKAADREELSAIDGITREKIESEEWVKQAKELLKNK
ncbi:50S ribosomal protein L21 [Gillisia hiemivivida]|jgi:large subunit ribosomal protein L21|uniref:Large ribosomal subunit protein bL21 n=1 Tax=Gillisia hiemivivida TaxID=291190 RepID=A0A5C6ZS55_9FLAO|nr:50S ribosomal protein L21 [Gillisia hiemivivida]TXD93619.1 50S ribosomal protein L21 [Gillisia hiemivivida]